MRLHGSAENPVYENPSDIPKAPIGIIQQEQLLHDKCDARSARLLGGKNDSLREKRVSF